MRTLAVSLLLCAVMALTRANGDNTMSVTNVELLARRTICPAGWTLFGVRCFLFVPTQMTWAQAQKNCLDNKAHLASIHSAEEHSFVQHMTTASLLPSWIGGSDCQEGSSWFWIDKTPVDFNPWCVGQPDSTLDQCCLQMNTGGAKCWDDQPCSTLNPSVCVMDL